MNCKVVNRTQKKIYMQSGSHVSNTTLVRDILAIIRTRVDQLGDSERVVASMILENPVEFSGVGLAALAEAAQVSQPTVIRFCRKLGFNGFSDFKVAYAQGTAILPKALHQEVAAGDSVNTIVRKVADSAIAAITSTRDAIDPDLAAKAAELIASARRIECFGNGTAHSVAVEAHNKIYRLGLPCSVTTDVFTQTILSGTLREGDVILYFSFSGEADFHFDSLYLAKSAGAKIIAFTRPGSHIAAAAHLLIPISVAEDFEAFTPISTPIAYMVAIDAITMCAAQLVPEEVNRRHAAGKAALKKYTQA